jgi:hypothetical protein
LRQLKHLEQCRKSRDECLRVFCQHCVGGEKVCEANDSGLAVVGKLDLVGAGEDDGGVQVGEDTVLDLVDAASEEVGTGVWEGAGDEQERQFEKAEEERFGLGSVEAGKEDEEDLLDIWGEGTTKQS